MEETSQVLEEDRSGKQTTDPAPLESDVLVAEAISQSAPAANPAEELKAVIEGAIYITDEPLTAEQIAAAVQQPIELVKELLLELVAEYAAPDEVFLYANWRAGIRCRPSRSIMRQSDGL